MNLANTRSSRARSGGMVRTAQKGVLFLILTVAMYAVPAFFYPLTGIAGIPVAEAAESVNNWWPVEGAVVTGVQPFKGDVAGHSVDSYQMFWQVDGGGL